MDWLNQLNEAAKWTYALSTIISLIAVALYFRKVSPRMFPGAFLVAVLIAVFPVANTALAVAALLDWIGVKK